MSNLLLTLCAVAAPQAASDDWPQYQGPDANGAVPSIGTNYDWGEEGPGVLWVLPIGVGYGGVAIRDGEVYMLDREFGRKDIVRVLDLESGEEKWRYEYEALGRLNFPGSRSTPAVTEKHVITAGAFGHVHCFDRETHEIVWSTHLEEVYFGEMPMYGWVGSPVLVGDLIVLAVLGQEVGLVALDHATGEEAWVTEPVGYSHSTPVLLELAGRPQILFMSTMMMGSGQELSAPTTISSFDPEEGTLIWRTEIELTRFPIPGPVQVDDERIFLTGGYRSGSTLMSIKKTGGEYAFEELFHIDRGAQVHAPLLHGDHLYLLVNENWNDSRARQKEGGLLCLSLEGEEVWRTGNDPYFGRGNAILAGDHLIIQDGRNGILRVVRATPEGYQPVAESNLFALEDERDRQMWAPMAVAGRYLLMRSQEELLCVEL